MSDLVLDPTSYDFDLFSPFLYNDQSYLFKQKGKCHFFLIHRHFMLASGGAVFDTKDFKWHNNNTYMSKLLSSSSKYEVQHSLNIDKIISDRYISKDASNRTNYLKTFENYTEKGLFTFDKSNISNPLDKAFHLVAYPHLDIENYLKIANTVNEELFKGQLNIINDKVEIEEYLEKLRVSISNSSHLMLKKDMSMFNIFKMKE